MIKQSAWSLKREDDGTYTLRAPNHRWLFNVSLNSLELLGRMFLNVVEDAEELEDLREALYE